MNRRAGMPARALPPKAAIQPRRPPALPPVYRPLPAPGSVQTKKAPVCPKPWRPGVPRAIQRALKEEDRSPAQSPTPSPATTAAQTRRVTGYIYRGDSRRPKEIVADGGFFWRDQTALPSGVGRGFCAATYNGSNASEIKTAVGRFSPTSSMFVYRFTADCDVTDLRSMPEQCFLGSNDVTQGREVIVHATIPPEQIEVAVGGNWRKITEFK